MSKDHEQAAPLKLGGFLSGVLIGGLAGTAVALLAAPQSGKKTRALIRHKTVELRDQAVETVDEAREQAEHAVSRARVQGQRVTRRVGATAREWQHRGQAILEEQKDRLESTLEALQPGAQNGRGLKN